MPTAPKPPPERDVAQLVLGLFAWLRDKGHTTATVPGRARRGVATALAKGTLDGLAKTMASAFLVALGTWIHTATPLMQEKHQRSAKKELATTLTNWLRDDESRSEAIRILQAFPLSRFSALIEQIAENAVDRVARAGASIEDQEGTRETWRGDARIFSLSSSPISSRGFGHLAAFRFHERSRNGRTSSRSSCKASVEQAFRTETSRSCGGQR